MNPLLRFGRRRSSWELDDAGAIADVEFRRVDGTLDLAPSVYEVEASDPGEIRASIIRLYTEHAASFLRSPPKGIRPLDLEGLSESVPTAGKALFWFANRCHRELRLPARGDLLRLIEQVKRECARRILEEVTASTMLDYASERLLAEDPEWLAAIEPTQNASAWLALIEKRRRRAGEP